MDDDAARLVSIPGAPAALDKAQRQFNRLTSQIQRQRELLQAWQAYRDSHLERMAAEIQPVLSAMRVAQRRIVQQMDVLLERDRVGTESLSRRHRATLRTQIAIVCADLLSDGPDAAIESVRDRHAVTDRRGRGRDPLIAAAALLREAYGADIVEAHGATTVEELVYIVRERVAARDAAQTSEAHAHRSCSHGGRPTRAAKAAARRVQSMEQAHLSLREVYRRLASSLHPDRAADPDERDRRTGLMQRANRAYAADDLHGLLALQIETAQRGAAQLAQAPSARIAHYNEMLKQQLAQLKAETDACSEPVLLELGLAPGATRLAADHAFNARLAQLRAFRRQLERDAAMLANPRHRGALLDVLAEQAEGSDDDGAWAALDALIAAATPRRPRGR
jgi:hypothetical protein